MIFIKIALLFLIAFDPQIPFLPNGVGFSLISLLILLPVALLKLSHEGSRQIINYSKPYLLLFFFCTLYITVRLIFNEGVNAEFYLALLKAFVIFIAVALWLIVFNKDYKNNNFIYFILCIYTLNAVINILAGTFSDFFSFLEMFRGAVISNELGKNPYRNSFLAGSGYYSIGTAYGLIALLIGFIIAKKNVGGYLSPIILGIVSISGFIAARTAFFAIGPALIYLIQARLKYLLYFSIIIFVMLNLIVMLPLLNPYVDWMLTFFDLQNNSSASYLIEQMYFWPGTQVFFYGEGVVNSGSYIYTDAGYMQDILFGGIIFLLLKLSFLGVFVFSYIRLYPLFTLLISFSVLLFHFKGLFLYNNAQGMAAFYFIYFYLSHLKHSNKISLF